MAEGRLQGNTFMTMKDLEIVLDIARTSGSAAPVAALVHSYFCHLLDQGYEADGIGGVARVYSKHPFVDLIRPPAEVAGAKQLRN
jgi:3-hydroxyisobutyrate dehydrogenase-like beta-hydroxyacid dehydrogenase